MPAKVWSQPMQAILSAMCDTVRSLDVVIFDEHMLLNARVCEWPQVDALIAFYSRGFPLHKVRAYVDLTQPFLVNDLEMQCVMRNRAAVYNVLKSQNIPQPQTIVCDRERGDGAMILGDRLVVSKLKSTGTDITGARSLTCDCDRGVCEICKPSKSFGCSADDRMTMCKPFVEKPLNADDHNVYVYYPGHVVRQLFRKTATASSILVESMCCLRARGSYIYQKFHQPYRCMDIKVYAVGDDYFYAVARKAPTVDGRVERTTDGLEIRHKILLTDQELDMCSRVSRAFRQYLIGFDILRANNQSYIIDVNGWSFVKDSREFTAYCGRRLANYILSNVMSSVSSPLRDSASKLNTEQFHVCSPCSP